jgi:ferrous iron transport protein A
MSCNVTQLKDGQGGKIRSFMDELTAGKLINMGILPGSYIQIVRRAPFNGGYYLKVDGANMVLRKGEAESIVLDI